MTLIRRVAQLEVRLAAYKQQKRLASSRPVPLAQGIDRDLCEYFAILFSQERTREAAAARGQPDPRFPVLPPFTPEMAERFPAWAAEFEEEMERERESEALTSPTKLRR